MFLPSHQFTINWNHHSQRLACGSICKASQWSRLPPCWSPLPLLPLLALLVFGSPLSEKQIRSWVYTVRVSELHAFSLQVDCDAEMQMRNHIHLSKEVKMVTGYSLCVRASMNRCCTELIQSAGGDIQYCRVACMYLVLSKTLWFGSGFL